MYRKTFVRVDGDILKNNIIEIKNKYNNYEYYIGVVKNNAYNHGIYTINDLIAGGINYLAVSSLEEAIDIRKYNLDIPILCLEPIEIEYIYDAINNNVTITIENLDYLEELNELKFKDTLKIHLKVDSGMNRLGFKSAKTFNKAMQIIGENKKLYLEGIYSHFATSGVSDKHWDNQLTKFKNITKDINLNTIPIIHLGRSLTLVNHDKIEFCNGIRLGIVMFGFAQNMKEGNFLQEFRRNMLIKKYDISDTKRTNTLKLRTAFSLYSKVMSIRKIKAGEFVGYNANYVAKEDLYIATLPIGYADGVTKKFKYVNIKGKRYEIVADTMDMIMVNVDKSIKIGDKVEIFGDNIKIKEVTAHLGVNAYHLFSQISTRVPRVHLKEGFEEEVKY